MWSGGPGNQETTVQGGAGLPSRLTGGSQASLIAVINKQIVHTLERGRNTGSCPVRDCEIDAIFGQNHQNHFRSKKI